MTAQCGACGAVAEVIGSALVECITGEALERAA